MLLEAFMDNKPSILVVEDSISWQGNYQEALESYGYNVTIVEDLGTALDKITKQYFHVAIIDLELKGERGNRDGREVIRRIWSLDEGTRFLVSSAKGEVAMFDEFREMGIFSFTQIPNEDQERMKGVSAYDGLIAKDNDPLEKILGDVATAMDKSWHDYIKSQWKQSPFGIIKGYTAKEIQRSLKVGKIEELRPFLSTLVRPLYPWLNRKVVSEIIKSKNNNNDGDVIAYESICWSRGLGHAVAIRFGRNDTFEESLKQQKVASSFDNAKIDKINEMAETHGQTPFRGAVYKLDIEFGDSFVIPPVKRADNIPMQQIGI
jgi:CheY-like chemotaxis protein